MSRDCCRSCDNPSSSRQNDPSFGAKGQISCQISSYVKTRVGWRWRRKLHIFSLTEEAWSREDVAVAVASTGMAALFTREIINVATGTRRESLLSCILRVYARGVENNWRLRLWRDFAIKESTSCFEERMLEVWWSEQYEKDQADGIYSLIWRPARLSESHNRYLTPSEEGVAPCVAYSHTGLTLSSAGRWWAIVAIVIFNPVIHRSICTEISPQLRNEKAVSEGLVEVRFQSLIICLALLSKKRITSDSRNYHACESQQCKNRMKWQAIPQACSRSWSDRYLVAS